MIPPQRVGQPHVVDLAKERDHQGFEGEDDAKHAAPEQQVRPLETQLREAVGRQHSDQQRHQGNRQRGDHAVHEEDGQIPHGQHLDEGIEDDGIGQPLQTGDCLSLRAQRRADRPQQRGAPQQAEQHSQRDGEQGGKCQFAIHLSLDD